MSKVVLLAIAAAVFCTISSAQTPQVHKVYVFAGSSESDSVVSSVKAKIGGTLRYELADTFADLWINILCVKTIIGDRVTGRTCAGTYSYHPPSLGYPYLHLNTSIHVGPVDSVQTPQDIFEAFVDETSENKLAANRTKAIGDIRFLCLIHKNKKDEVDLACNGL